MHGHCVTRVENLGVVVGRRQLLSGISFELKCGEFTAIVGRNGAGKTTLLKALLGEQPHTGTVKFTGHGKSGRPVSGYVPQRVPLDPNAPVSVRDLFGMGLKREGAERTRKRLEAFGAGGLLNRRLCELSGGEWQRVMLAYAVTPEPELLILDEPSAGIDAAGTEDLYENLSRLKEEHDVAVLMVSHDFNVLRARADRCLLLDGGIRADGSPAEVFSSAAFKESFNADV